MTIQLPLSVAIGPDGSPAVPPEDVPADGFAALIDALVAALAGSPSNGDGGQGAPGEPSVGAVASEAGTGAVRVPAPGPPVAAPAAGVPPALIATVPAVGPGAVLPGCSCCGGAVPEQAQARSPVQAVAPSGTADATLSPPSVDTAAASSVPAPAAVSGADAASGLTARIVERVVEIVARQQAVTPPSTMVIEVPEVRGGRIAISMHAAGVHLAFSGLGSSELGPLLPQLAAGLALQGMVLAGWSADAEGGVSSESGQTPDGGDGEQPRRDPDQAESFAEYLGI